MLASMKSETRRKERSQEIIEVLKPHYNDLIDLVHFESENKALELKGSLVTDWQNGKIYCSLSSRSDPEVFQYLITKLNDIVES